MDIQPLLIAQFHFRGVEKLNLIRHREYQMLHQDMRAPLQSTQDATQDDRRPMELAMMDLQALQLSIVQNRVDLFYMFHPHLRPATDHQAFGEIKLSKN